MRSFDDFFACGPGSLRTGRLGHDDLNASEYAADLRDLHTAAQFDALLAKRVQHDLRALPVLALKRHLGFEDRNLGAKPAKRLRQFEAGPSSTEDEEVARTIGETEHRFGRQIRRLGEPWNLRDDGQRAGRNNKTARSHGGRTDHHRAGVPKSRGPRNYPHAETFEALRRILRGDRLDGAAHVSTHSGKIDAGASAPHPEIRADPHGVGMLGRRLQRPRRHRPAIEALAAHSALFDEHDRHAHRGSARGGGKAAWAGTDHTDFRIKFVFFFAIGRPKFHRIENEGQKSSSQEA